MKMEQILKRYSLFRRNMGIPIDIKVLSQFWGKEGIDTLSSSEVRKIVNPVIEKKIKIAKESLKHLLLFNWVKYIAISGSVASGFAKNDDDIDIFIVVKNDRKWLYRGIILFKNLFHRRIRIGEGDNIKNMLCLNFILEERGLKLESDLFNLNEIISLIPLYEGKYFNVIMNNNQWIFDDFLISRKILMGESFEKDSLTKRYPLIKIVDFIFSIAQLFYMIIFNHNPNIQRIFENNKKGRIEFFPEGFKEEKLKMLERGEVN